MTFAALPGYAGMQRMMHTKHGCLLHIVPAALEDELDTIC